MGISRVDEEATRKLQNALRAAKEQLAAGAGLALANWSVVEMKLGWLFVSILDRTRKPVPTGLIPWEDENPQRRIYHSIFSAIVSFPASVDIVGAAFEASDLRKDLKKLWPGTAARLKRLYKSRHEAAHFIFDQLHDPDDGSYTVLLAPFPTTVVSTETKRLGLKELDHKVARFLEMGDALAWFWHAIEMQRRRLKGPRPPAPALIQRVRQSLRTQTQQAQP